MVRPYMPTDFRLDLIKVSRFSSNLKIDVSNIYLQDRYLAVSSVSESYIRILASLGCG